MSYFRWNAGRKRQGTPTLESQPGAHTGASRQYIPSYADANIIFLNTSSGNDALDGTSIANAKLTYASAATAAGTTKKIRLVNSATLTDNISKPTEATIGTTSTIKSASLTAPIDTWTQQVPWSSGNANCMRWVPWLSKWVTVTDGNYIYMSPYPTAWSAAASPNFAGGYAASLCVAENLRILVAAGQGAASAPRICYSTDGSAWTAATLPASYTGQLNSVAYSETAGKFVAVGSGVYALISTDGITWNQGGRISDVAHYGLCFSDSKWVTSDTSGAIYYSPDGTTWTAAATNTATYATSNGIIHDAVSGRYLMGAISGYVWRSTDGITWTQSTTNTGGFVYGIEHIIEIGYYVSVGQGNRIYYSTDGDTWTAAATPSYGVGVGVKAIAYSPVSQIVMTGGESAKSAISTAFATTVSASVAGFTLQAVQYSGTVTAYNCTLKQPGATAALSFDSCRITETGSHISNNAVSAIATLIEGDMTYSGTYAAANALDLNLNTVSGTLYVYNGSATNYERIRDNIIESGIITSYPVTVASGNTRGTSSDGTIFGQFCTTSDPMFVDTTDYKLKRVLDGYQYASPMVAASQYYYNAATTQTFRDNGAWSYNESAATYKYQRTFNFTMPATAIGSSIEFIRHNRANLHVAEDGTPDSVNTPDSRYEQIVMTFKTLPSDHIDFINWLEGQVDMTCDISLDPSTTPTTSITASGATASGNAVITVTDNSTIDSGDILTIDGYDYTVLYTYSTDKIVLDRITTTALTDTESITVKYDSGFGEYQYVPQLERRLSRWYETDDSYARGLIVRFARKLP